MALTRTDARERATLIWSVSSPLSSTITLRDDGGADVQIRTHAHRLDRDGHAVCHAECAAAEIRRTAKRDAGKI
jgi:hypothetical protein